MKTPIIVTAVVATINLSVCLAPLFAQDALDQVVINEIHYDEVDKTLRGEFIEIFNPTDAAVDLSGWFFAEGVDFTFPAGTAVESGGYLVVAENPEVLAGLYNGVSALGPWTGSLKNSGETIVLRNATGKKIDEVTYALGFPWPSTGEDPSPSIELIHPSLDNDLGGSWRASGNVPSSPAMGLLGREESSWQYWKGSEAPALDASGRDWKDPDYVAAWPSGQTPIGIGDDDDTTLIDDMQGNYIGVIARHTFELADGPLPSSLELELYFDDGVVALLNGQEVARVSVDTAWEVSHTAPNGTASSHEAQDYEAQQIRGAGAYLRVGTNVLTLVGLNSSIGGSDFSLDGSLRSVEPEPGDLIIDPSPGRQNSVFAANAPPQTRQVTQTPTSPKSGEAVTISAKITDPDGVAEATLLYQLVNPGDYIALSDERYATEWTSVPMQAGAAGTDTYTAIMPGELQTHRRLVRYRIMTSDTPAAAIQVPYVDDPQPNFAYFVYDQVPSYTGKATTSAEPVTYSPETLSVVPVYQLITTRDHHESAQYIPDASGSSYGGSDYRWEGTMVYDGRVYDHIRYRARGGVWRYAMGKNMWKFDFNRGHRFQARDDYGSKYKTEWDKVNFSACIQQGDFNHRGEQGLFESTGFKLFNLSGVEAPRTHFLHFRIIEGADENGQPDSQFDTDFQGLYLAIEQPDGQFLEEHGMADGNFYKIEAYAGESNNQGPTQPSNRSDVRDFINGFRNATPDADWWRANIDVDRALSYHSITEAIHHYDIAYGKNYYYYHNPDTGLFEVHPWDLDLTWADNMYGNGQHNILQKLCKREPFNVDYQNRMREIVDLLYNPEQTGMLIDEMAAVVYQPGQPSFVDADRAMWDYNPILRSPRHVNSSKAGHGRFYSVGVGSKTFAGMIQKMKNYVDTRTGFLQRTYLRNESDIPETPVITYSGTAGYPPDGLKFDTSAFASPTNASFAGLKWRIAEVTDPGAAGFDPYNRVEPRTYEMETTWESPVMTTFEASINIPALESRPAHTYRARVRHLDSDGRWSHWSAPIQFVTGDPDITAFQQQLVVSELMYNPAPPATGAELAVSERNSDFEYLVLQNIGPATLDLTNVRLTKGVDFDFPEGTILGAGAKVFVVKNLAAFSARYGAQVDSLVVAGEWDAADNLNDGGESIRVAYGAGSVIREFEYGDKAPWPESADGAGYSLILIDTSQLIDPTKPVSWNASTKLNGSLGTVEGASGYAAWKAKFGVTSDDSDTDGDGVPALVEYALRRSPRVANPSALSGTTDSTGTYLEIAFQWDTQATDASFTLRTSADLAAWSDAPAERFALTSELNLGDGLVRRVYRDTLPMTQSITQYVQLKVSIVP
jgi:hypothetical protein